MTVAVATALIFAVAVLYSSVGLAGATGYVAVLALCGFAPGEIKPVALTLNALVAMIATARFARAGGFSWSTFWPFAAGSVPLAFVGGAVTLPGVAYRPIVGAALLGAAWRLLAADPRPQATRPAPPGMALVAGMGIGFVSGLTGLGGGILLTPLLLLLGWADARRATTVAAAFNLVNSLAGLAGDAARLGALPAGTPYWAAAATLGGLVGSGFGSRDPGRPALRRVLAVLLAAAGVKLVLPT